MSQKKPAITLYLILLIHATGFSQFFLTTECLEKKKQKVIYTILIYISVNVKCLYSRTVSNHKDKEKKNSA